MVNCYWENTGRYQELDKKLMKLIPDEGEVNSKFPALEKLRIASNCYYDLYNNGLCNRAKEFRKVFGMAGTKIFKGEYPNPELETKLDNIIIMAGIEQNLVEVK